jgi:hypothetical protein
MALAIKRESLLSLEAYARERASFRAKVLEHKKLRKVHLGGHVTLDFEDELTVRYQVQEMLRIERIFEEQGIQHELDAAMRERLKGGARVTAGIDHPEYRASTVLAPGVRGALLADLH